MDHVSRRVNDCVRAVSVCGAHTTYERVVVVTKVRHALRNDFAVVAADVALKSSHVSLLC